MKCKRCVYFTGVQCHGHGEFWGDCLLLHFAIKEIVQKSGCDYVSTNMNSVCFDDTECLIAKFFDWKEKKL